MPLHCARKLQHDLRWLACKDLRRYRDLWPCMPSRRMLLKTRGSQCDGDFASANILMMLPFLTQPADGGSSGIASLILPTASLISVIVYYSILLLFLILATSYIAFLPFLDPAVVFIGPISFSDPSSNPPGRTSSFRQMLPFLFWASLTALCVASRECISRHSVPTPQSRA